MLGLAEGNPRTGGHGVGVVEGEGLERWLSLGVADLEVENDDPTRTSTNQGFVQHLSSLTRCRRGRRFGSVRGRHVEKGYEPRKAGRSSDRIGLSLGKLHERLKIADIRSRAGRSLLGHLEQPQLYNILHFLCCGI